MEEKIFDILKKIRPEFNFAGSDDFVEDGYLDSFDVIELISCIEEEFDVVINGLDILPENFKSLEAIVETIKRNGEVE
ncbi:MAG: phosphopantetheine-binding protein [Ruminococcus flavefaciens]|nr:phosphopantetheine-binding protein [Ruminococcus flavefaciens]